MRHVYIVGMGATRVAEYWDRSILSLTNEALQAALTRIDGTRLDALYVANALGGAIGLQTNLGAAVASAAGLRGIEAFTVEASGASGGVALRQAYLAVAGGMADLVAVVGAEKVTDVLDGHREAATILAGDPDWEAVHGATATAQWAMLMRRYMHQYGVPAEAFAPFPVNAHANGTANPLALYQFSIAPDKVRGAALVADPLGLLDCSTAADGAAVLLLASDQLARELGDSLRIRVAGSAVATDTPALHSRPDPLWLSAAERSATKALRAANIALGDVDVFEFSDPHGIAAALALEACGIAERGMATSMAREGAIRTDGASPISTGGGYKARGDVGGANGIYQVIELAHQLHGTAGKAQVPDARVALAQCLGGIAATVATHVLVAEQY